MKHPEPASTPMVKAFGGIAGRKGIPLAITILSLAAMLLSGQPAPLAYNIISSAYGDHYDLEVAGASGQGMRNDNDGKGDGRYDPIADTSYYSNLTQYSYVLYYGQFDSSITSSIISAKPTLLVTNYYAMDGDTRERFAEHNITVIAYLPISWTHRDIDSALGEARQLLADGADGIFVDEAATMSSDWELWYHGQIYQSVKEYDEDKIVVINPGTASIDKDSMLVADIICFEHDWRNFGDVEWARKYPGWRFMGISSNEFPEVMGYDVGKESARQDLEEARHLNIAYHYSADHYIWLPPWLDVYGGIAGSPHPVSDYSHQLDLDSIEQARAPPYYPAITETEQVGNEYNSTIIEKAPELEEESDEQPAISDQEEEEEPSPVDEEAAEEGEEEQPEADDEQQDEGQQEEEEPAEDSEETSNEESAEEADEESEDQDEDDASGPTDKEEERSEDGDSNGNSTSQGNSTEDNNSDDASANSTYSASDPEIEGDEQPSAKDAENATATS